MVCSTLPSTLQVGLWNWQRLWPSEFRDYELLDTTVAAQGLWFQRIGFQRYAPEYWLYTYSTVERARYRALEDQATEAEVAKPDDPDMIRFNALLHEFGSMNLVSA